MARRPWRDVLRDHHAAGRQAGSAPRGADAHAEAATDPAGAGRRTTAGRHPEPHQPLVRLAFRMARAGDDHARDGWAIEELNLGPHAYQAPESVHELCANLLTSRAARTSCSVFGAFRHIRELSLRILCARMDTFTATFKARWSFKRPANRPFARALRDGAAVVVLRRKVRRPPRISGAAA